MLPRPRAVLSAPLLLLCLATPALLPAAAQDLADAGTEAVASGGLAGWQPGPGQPLDMARFMGRWYVVARVPHPVERGHVASTLDYRLAGSERVDIDYRYRDGVDGQARLLPLRARTDGDSGHRRWRTWYYRVLPSRTSVLEVAQDYSWALVGQRGGAMAWILARDVQMSQEQYHGLGERLAAHGYNTDRMRRVVHSADQVGRLGFETPPRP